MAPFGAELVDLCVYKQRRMQLAMLCLPAVKECAFSFLASFLAPFPNCLVVSWTSADAPQTDLISTCDVVVVHGGFDFVFV